MNFTENGQCLKCDFCDSIIDAKRIKIVGGSSGWNRATARQILPIEPVCYREADDRVACKKEVCQAKLILWANNEAV